MIPKIIKTEKDYERALARINDLVDADPDTPEGDELELLVTLVELYERGKHPIDLPDPVEAIRFRMEQLGLKQKEWNHENKNRNFKDSPGDEAEAEERL